MSGLFMAPDAEGDATIWQYDPDRPDQPTALLRECDLAREARLTLWPVLAERALPVLVVIVAPSMQAARDTARAESVPTHARTTHFVTRPEALRGLTLRPWDRVVWSSAPWPYGSASVLDEIDYFLGLARLSGEATK